MEIQDNFQDDLIFKLDLNEHIDKQEKKQKKILNLAAKSLRKLAEDAICNKVGEC